MPDDRPTARGLPFLARAVVVTVAATGVVTAGRLFAVSGYQVPTATAVLRSQGTAATVVGAVVPVLGALLPFVAALLVAATVVAILFGSRAVRRCAVAAVVAVVATLLVSPSAVGPAAGWDELRGTAVPLLARGDWLPVGLAGGVLLVVGLVRRDTVPGFRLGRFLVLGVVVTALLAGFALVAVDAYRPVQRAAALPSALGRMWLPAERIVPAAGPPRIGYVLSTEGGWTTVVWDDDRAIGLLPPGGVTARTVCRTGPADDPPLLFPAPRMLTVACPVPPAGSAGLPPAGGAG